MSSSKSNLSHGAWILREATHTGQRVWGLTSAERTARALRAAGVMQVTEVDAAPDITDNAAQLLFRADIVLDEHLVSGLVAAPGTILMDPERGIPVAAHVPADRAADCASWLRAAAQLPREQLAGLRVVEPSSFGDTWVARLRRSAAPRLYSLAGADAAGIAAIERELFGASYKVVTDLVTKWLWPLPARLVVKRLANARVHPNWVTLASWLLAALATLLFAGGHLASGLVLAWMMTFLDTVDGKLARVTLTSSNFGHVFDHALDLLHPPFWYAAFAAGLAVGAVASGSVVVASMWIVIVGYVVGRLLEGIFLLAFKIEIHSWTPLDSAFRTITARRNPNLLLLTGGLLAGRAELGLVAVAVWTLLSIAFHVARLTHAFAEQRQGREIAAWNAVSTAAIGALIVAALLGATAPAARAQDETTISKPSPSDVSLAPTHSVRRGDPASRLPHGELAIETWDFTARFDSGHVLVMQLLHTNIGFGDGNVAMTGQLVMPEGRVVAFDTGDKAGEWKLSPDGLRLELQHGLLDQTARDVVLRFAKKHIEVDLRLTNTGPPGWPATLSRLGYAVDLIESAAPIAGTIRVDGMSAPLAVKGRASSTHRWFSDLEAHLVQRRIEFASTGDTSVWLIDTLTPDGRNIGWLRVARGGAVLREVEVHTTALAPSTPPDGSPAHRGYDVPSRIRIEGPGVTGMLSFDRELVRYDPLVDLPLPIRAVVSLATKPQRIWNQSTFELELSDPAGSTPLRVRGSGIGEVTYLNPMAARSVHVDVSRARACKENGCASAF